MTRSRVLLFLSHGFLPYFRSFRQDSFPRFQILQKKLSTSIRFESPSFLRKESGGKKPSHDPVPAKAAALLRKDLRGAERAEAEAIATQARRGRGRRPGVK